MVKIYCYAILSNVENQRFSSMIGNPLDLPTGKKHENITKRKTLTRKLINDWTITKKLKIKISIIIKNK